MLLELSSGQSLTWEGQCNSGSWLSRPEENSICHWFRAKASRGLTPKFDSRLSCFLSPWLYEPCTESLQVHNQTSNDSLRSGLALLYKIFFNVDARNQTWGLLCAMPVVCCGASLCCILLHSSIPCCIPTMQPFLGAFHFLSKEQNHPANWVLLSCCSCQSQIVLQKKKKKKEVEIPKLDCTFIVVIRRLN